MTTNISLHPIVSLRIRPDLTGVELAQTEEPKSANQSHYVNPDKCRIEYISQTQVATCNDIGKLVFYQFNHVHAPDALDAPVANDTAQPALRAIREGFNACVMCYGQSGAGKTHNIENGICPAALDALFGMESEVSNLRLSISAVELHRDALQDLLDPANSKPRMQWNGVTGRREIADNRYVPVASAQEASALLKKAWRLRCTSATSLNARSSRSHAFYFFKVAFEVQDPKKPDKKIKREPTVTIVDLAGSERVDESGVTGDKLQEAIVINRSLAHLGGLVRKIADPKKHGALTNASFKENTLTAVLQPWLQKSSISLLLCVPSSALYRKESVSTMRFGENMLKVETIVEPQSQSVGGADSDNPLVQELTEKLRLLQEKLDVTEQTVENMRRQHEIEIAGKADENRALQSALQGVQIQRTGNGYGEPADELEDLEERLEELRQQHTALKKEIDSKDTSEAARAEAKAALTNVAADLRRLRTQILVAKASEKEEDPNLNASASVVAVKPESPSPHATATELSPAPLTDQDLAEARISSMAHQVEALRRQLAQAYKRHDTDTEEELKDKIKALNKQLEEANVTTRTLKSDLKKLENRKQELLVKLRNARFQNQVEVSELVDVGEDESSQEAIKKQHQQNEDLLARSREAAKRLEAAEARFNAALKDLSKLIAAQTECVRHHPSAVVRADTAGVLSIVQEHARRVEETVAQKAKPLLEMEVAWLESADVKDQQDLDETEFLECVERHAEILAPAFQRLGRLRDQIVRRNELLKSATPAPNEDDDNDNDEDNDNDNDNDKRGDDTGAAKDDIDSAAVAVLRNFDQKLKKEVATMDAAVMTTSTERGTKATSTGGTSGEGFGGSGSGSSGGGGPSKRQTSNNRFSDPVSGNRTLRKLLEQLPASLDRLGEYLKGHTEEIPEFRRLNGTTLVAKHLDDRLWTVEALSCLSSICHRSTDVQKDLASLADKAVSACARQIEDVERQEARWQYALAFAADACDGGVRTLQAAFLASSLLETMVNRILATDNNQIILSATMNGLAAIANQFPEAQRRIAVELDGFSKVAGIIRRHGGDTPRVHQAACQLVSRLVRDNKSLGQAALAHDALLDQLVNLAISKCEADTAFTVGELAGIALINVVTAAGECAPLTARINQHQILGLMLLRAVGGMIAVTDVSSFDSTNVPGLELHAKARKAHFTAATSGCHELGTIRSDNVQYLLHVAEPCDVVLGITDPHAKLRSKMTRCGTTKAVFLGIHVFDLSHQTAVPAADRAAGMPYIGDDHPKFRTGTSHSFSNVLYMPQLAAGWYSVIPFNNHGMLSPYTISASATRPISFAQADMSQVEVTTFVKCEMGRAGLRDNSPKLTADAIFAKSTEGGAEAREALRRGADLAYFLAPQFQVLPPEGASAGVECSPALSGVEVSVVPSDGFEALAAARTYSANGQLWGFYERSIKRSIGRIGKVNITTKSTNPADAASFRIDKNANSSSSSGFFGSASLVQVMSGSGFDQAMGVESTLTRRFVAGSGGGWVVRAGHVCHYSIPDGGMTLLFKRKMPDGQTEDNDIDENDNDQQTTDPTDPWDSMAPVTTTVRLRHQRGVTVVPRLPYPFIFESQPLLVAPGSSETLLHFPLFYGPYLLQLVVEVAELGAIQVMFNGKGVRFSYSHSSDGDPTFCVGRFSGEITALDDATNEDDSDADHAPGASNRPPLLVVSNRSSSTALRCIVMLLHACGDAPSDKDEARDAMRPSPCPPLPMQTPAIATSVVAGSVSEESMSLILKWSMWEKREKRLEEAGGGNVLVAGAVVLLESGTLHRVISVNDDESEILADAIPLGSVTNTSEATPNGSHLLRIDPSDIAAVYRTKAAPATGAMPLLFQ